MHVHKPKDHGSIRSDSMRLAELRAFVGLCFMEFQKREMSVVEIAHSGRISDSTVYKLRKDGVSLASHFGTIQAVGEVAGLRLILSKGLIRMSTRRRVA